MEMLAAWVQEARNNALLHLIPYFLECDADQYMQEDAPRQLGHSSLLGI